MEMREQAPWWVSALLAVLAAWQQWGPRGGVSIEAYEGAVSILSEQLRECQGGVTIP